MDARLIKQKPIHIHEEFPAHEWELDEYGNIDKYAMEYGYHNGPACIRCGYSFCVHCDPDGWNKTPCVMDENHCPNCEHIVISSENYCPNCGQALDWEKDM